MSKEIKFNGFFKNEIRLPFAKVELKPYCPSKFVGITKAEVIFKDAEGNHILGKDAGGLIIDKDEVKNLRWVLSLAEDGIQMKPEMASWGFLVWAKSYENGDLKLFMDFSGGGFVSLVMKKEVFSNWLDTLESYYEQDTIEAKEFDCVGTYIKGVDEPFTKMTVIPYTPEKPIDQFMAEVQFEDESQENEKIWYCRFDEEDIGKIERMLEDLQEDEDDDGYAEASLYYGECVWLSRSNRNYKYFCNRPKGLTTGLSIPCKDIDQFLLAIRGVFHDMRYGKEAD